MALLKKRQGPAVLQATSLAEYLSRIKEHLQAWTDEEGVGFTPWFRGHHEASWKLQPSVYRDRFVELSEDDCRHDFKQRAYPYLAGSARDPVDNWEWYFVMQHHGLPTRLLDWSESPIIALYFALREATGRKAVCVWMLDPWWLNEHTAGFDNEIFRSDDPRVASYLPPIFAQGIVIPAAPIAIEPLHTSRRIAVQRGVFTLHGSEHKPLEKLPELEPRLVKIIIPRGCVSDIRADLRLAGMSETLVFPELPGLCRELLDYWLG